MFLNFYRSTLRCCTAVTFFTFAIFVALSHPAYGAQPKISRSTLSAQIDQPIIAAIHRDSIGFLWIGTQEGLYKYDGSRMAIFNSDGRNENWIPSSDIRGISENSDGDLIVATYGGGLIKWNRHLGNFSSIPQFESNDVAQLTNLHISSNGSVWVSTKDKLFLYDDKLNTKEEWLESEDIQISIGRPYAFLESSLGSLFVGGSTGLLMISTRNKTAVHFDLTVLGIKNVFGVTALELDLNGNLIIGTDSGHVALLDTNLGIILAHAKVGKHTSTFVSDFALYDDKLLIATDKGLYLSETDFSSIRDLSLEGSGLSSSDIYTLYSDKTHIWIGTYNGLDILSYSPFELFDDKSSGVYNDTLAFAQDDNGRIWVGTYSGLYRYNDATKTHRRFESIFPTSNLIDQRITALSFSQDLLWLGYYRGGIQGINLSSGKAYIPEIDNSGEMLVTDISSQKDSQDLWVATYNHGLLRVTRDKTYYYFRDGSLPEKRISLVFHTSAGNLLVSSTNRIYQYDHDTDQFKYLKFHFGLDKTEPLVLSIFEDPNGNIWFGTKNSGLFLWTKSDHKSNRFHLAQVGEDGDFNYSTIYGIELDYQGNLWCSTQSGIVKLDPKGNLIEKFTTIDGLQGNDFNVGAAFTSSKGLIYFGGVNGYNRFDPSAVEIDRSFSPMRLTGILLPGGVHRNPQKLTGMSSLQLTHEDQFVTFEFSLLDFSYPEKNQFRYKLENFDSDWIDNGSRNTATYTNLPAGKYRFRVQGANSSGIWNREGITLQVQVLPAPWLTWWAIFIYVALLLFLLWCALRIYRSYSIDRESAQLATEMFEAESRADNDMQEQLELQAELVHSAYQHNVTTLSLVGDCISIQSTNRQGQVDFSTGSINRITALANLEDCLYYQAGGPVANLQKYTEVILSNLLQKSPIDPETIVTINEVPARLLPAELASPLALVLYELLENCIFHAFEPESPVNYIQIKMGFQTENDGLSRSLQLSVRDSGIGLPDELEALIERNSGIAIVHSVIKRLGGTLDVSDGPGTTISLNIPETQIM